jgi:hypothetical protein
MAWCLLIYRPVDRGIIATATELFEARHFPCVVAVCSDALEEEPECTSLLLIRARSHLALRRDLDAQADLRDIIRLDPGCGMAFRLLGELAARRDEHVSAAIFFREALRLSPADSEAAEWLAIVSDPARAPAVAPRVAPAVAAPVAPAVAAPPRPRATSPGVPAGTVQLRARGPELPATAPGPGPIHARPTIAVAVPPVAGALAPARAARGTRPQLDDDGTAPFERHAAPAPAVRPSRARAQVAQRSPTPELPGFGEYLVATGILTRDRLRAAMAYQKSMQVQLATAVVTLGLASPQRIEWAAVAHQSQLARDRVGAG